MKKLLLISVITLNIGCSGLHANSTVYEKGDFMSQSFPFFEYPANETALTDFVTNTEIYNNCIDTNRTPLATYQDGLMGNLSIFCQ